MDLMRLGGLVRSIARGIVVAALVAGCASIGAGSRSTEELVLERASARWKALIARDWATAYQYMTPAYRAIVPLARYGNQFVGAPVQWDSVKTHGAKCEERRCVVTVELFFRLILPGQMDRLSSTYLEETWVLEDGEWFKFEAL